MNPTADRLLALLRSAEFSPISITTEQERRTAEAAARAGFAVVVNESVELTVLGRLAIRRVRRVAEEAAEAAARTEVLAIYGDRLALAV